MKIQYLLLPRTICFRKKTLPPRYRYFWAEKITIVVVFSTICSLHLQDLSFVRLFQVSVTQRKSYIFKSCIFWPTDYREFESFHIVSKCLRLQDALSSRTKFDYRCLPCGVYKYNFFRYICYKYLQKAWPKFLPFPKRRQSTTPYAAIDSSMRFVPRVLYAVLLRKYGCS